MRIYVCGPLSNLDPAIREANVQRAIDAAIELYRLGHAPYLPHLTHWVDLRQQELGVGLEYETWLATDLEWLRQCHALLYLGSSPGADREYVHAKERGLVIFESLADVPTNQAAVRA